MEAVKERKAFNPNMRRDNVGKVYNTKVKARHRVVLDKLSENNGIISKAIIAASYSKSVAKKPQLITESKSWQQLLEENLPDSLLTSTHNKLIRSKDENIQSRAVDLGYKVKQKYQETTINNNTIVVMPSQAIGRVAKLATPIVEDEPSLTVKP